MNTFTRLFLRSSLLTLVFLGFALMFNASDVDAQNIVLASGVDPAQADYDEGDEVNITFTLTENGSPKVGELLNIVSRGVNVVRQPSNNSRTNANGVVTMTIAVGATAPRDVKATWPKLNRNSQVVNFDHVPTVERPNIVVLPPDPKKELKVGDTFTQTIAIRDVKDLSAWQMDVVFNPNILEVVGVDEGDFLEQGGINALFLSSSLTDSNAAGRVRLSQSRIGREPATPPATGNLLTKPSPTGVDKPAGQGEAELVTLKFKVLEFAEEVLGIHNVQLSNSDNERISYSIVVTDVFVATHQFPREDVNRDGRVNVQDLMMVANAMGSSNSNLGQAKPIDPRTDVNDDGFVNVLDLVAVYSSTSWAESVNATSVRRSNEASLSAPSTNVEVLTPATIRSWIDLARVEDDGSAVFDAGIAKLEALLASKIPSETKLLLNYPNPFNPETWIPYQLAKATEVTLTIHAMNGSLIRTLALGHQAAGVYKSKSQAAYWDGRNEFGEQVASGLYFYTLTAGDFSATGKMLVRK